MKPSNKEFIHRTIKVLEQYENVKDKLDCSYSRTLFINCCVGLLLLSKDVVYKKLPNTKIHIVNWAISTDNIQQCKPYVSPKQVIRHLRNAISHGNFEFAVEDGLSIPIDNISFEDYDKNGDLTFKALISFDDFKKLVLKVSNEALRIIDNKL